jgi:hypothetical protein
VLRTLFRPARVRGRVVQVMVDVPVEFSSAASPPVTIDPLLDEAARQYVEKARFSPGRIAGRAVRVRLQLPVEFRLPSRDWRRGWLRSRCGA